MNNMFMYRLGQKRGSQSGGSSGGGGSAVEPIPITADNINQYFDIVNDAESFVWNDNKLTFAPNAMVGDILTLTALQDVTFSLKIDAHIYDGGYLYIDMGDISNTFSLENVYGASPTILDLPTHFEMKSGDELVFDVGCYTTDSVTLSDLSVIPK